MFYLKKSTSPLKAILASTSLIVSLSFSFHINAQAADLSGDCCDYLEESVIKFDNIRWQERFRGNRRNSLMRFEIFREVMNTPLADREKAINRLKSYSHAPFINTMLEADKRFGNALMSCPSHGGISAVTKEGQCNWFKITAGTTDRDSNSNGPGFEQTNGGFAGGVQFALKDQWRFGFGGALDFSDTDIADATQHYSSSEGTRLTVGGVLKNQWGALNGYFSVTGSQGFVTPQLLFRTCQIGNFLNQCPYD